MSRRQGRPRNADRPVIPWPEIDRLLVFGEVVRDEATGHEDLRYPSYRELGRRYGVSGSLIGQYATQHQCMQRREDNRLREQIRFEQKVIEKRAEARALSTAEAIGIIDEYLRGFQEAVADGRVRFDSPGDFNTMARLKEFLTGNADSRQEVQGVVTLDQLQMRHRALRDQLEGIDPALTGAVMPIDEDEEFKGGLSAQAARAARPAPTRADAPAADAPAADAASAARVVH
jgi:hypothetical protein